MPSSETDSKSKEVVFVDRCAVHLNFMQEAESNDLGFMFKI